MMPDIRGLPFREAAIRASELLVEHPTAQVYFKFTCEKCNSRQGFETPNTLYESGICEECGHTTDLTTKTDIGYMVMMQS
jgi:hypothetical protein